MPVETDNCHQIAINRITEDDELNFQQVNAQYSRIPASADCQSCWLKGSTITPIGEPILLSSGCSTTTGSPKRC